MQCKVHSKAAFRTAMIYSLRARVCCGVDQHLPAALRDRRRKRKNEKKKKKAHRTKIVVVDHAPNQKRQRMFWRERMSMSSIEFTRRYRLTKEEFADLVVTLHPLLCGKRKTKLQVELQVSICLCLLAGGSYLDVADLHGVHSPLSKM